MAEEAKLPVDPAKAADNGHDDDAGSSSDEGPAAAAAAAADQQGEKKKKKKKSSKRKKVKDALTGGSSQEPGDISRAIAGLNPAQISELLNLNPALAQELQSAAAADNNTAAGATSGSDQSAALDALKRLNLQDIMTGLAASGKNVKDMGAFKFWQTQPVPRLDEAKDKSVTEGPIKPQTLADVPKEPYPLVDGFEWTTLDLLDDAQLKEVYELLNGHYVEDDEAMFRFNYTRSILKWALMPPGWRPEWYRGVRAVQSKKLVAFIGAIPLDFRVRENVIKGSEVNFICVHKKLRSKRLAPLLIKEITRLINLQEVWQALYTAGVVLPTPVSTCRYYHRALNWQKLYEVGFSPLPPNSKPQYQVKKYALPEQTSTKGLREMQPKDLDAVQDLMERYFKRYDLVGTFNREEVEHWLLYKDSAPDGEPVVWTYVVEDANKKITDFFSFYSLESSIINHPKHRILRVAYLFYYASETGLGDKVDKEALKTRLNALVHDALILARRNKFDVFNALSIMDNPLFLEKQLFGPGDGQLHYYLFNYRANPIGGGIDRTNKLDEKNLSGVGFAML